MRIRTTIELNGRTATGFSVPDDVVASFDRGRRVPVVVTIGPHVYRTTIASMGGRFMVPLSAENRSAAGVAAGDEIDVDLEVDDAPRVLEVPDDLRTAIDADPEAATFFDGLSFSHRRAYVDWVTSAKQDATRQRRIGQAVERLHERRTR